ncbi:hypothetical protein ACP70R_011992 [Stipagrostis hirtigluma subsp. patula]
MGQCPFFRQPAVEQGETAAAVAGGGLMSFRQEKLEKPAARARSRKASMRQTYSASSQDELVLVVSLDAITKIG